MRSKKAVLRAEIVLTWADTVWRKWQPVTSNIPEQAGQTTDTRTRPLLQTSHILSHLTPRSYYLTLITQIEIRPLTLISYHVSLSHNLQLSCLLLSIKGLDSTDLNEGGYTREHSHTSLQAPLNQLQLIEIQLQIWVDTTRCQEIHFIILQWYQWQCYEPIILFRSWTYIAILL